MWVSFWVSVALAHHPHDPTRVAELSPAYQADRTIFTSRLPGQNWRPQEVIVSRDDGLTWWSAYRGLTNASALVELDLSPSFDTDGIGLVTTAGDGAFLTTDGGDTWFNVLPAVVLGQGAIATDASGALVLLAQENSGPLWRSTDLGATWDAALTPADGGALHAFGQEIVLGDGRLVHSSQDAGLTWDVVDLGGPEVLSVATAPGVRIVGTRGGVFLSTQLGVYERLSGTTNVPTGEVTAVGVSPDFANDHLLLAADILRGPYASIDGGQSWLRRPTNVPISPQDPIHFYSFRMSPNFATDHTVLLNTWEGLILSRDMGFTWEAIETRHPALLTGIGISPDYPADQTVLLGTFDAGMLTSTDRGAAFTIHNVGLSKSSIYDIDVGLDAAGDPVAMIGLRDRSGWGAPPWDEWELRPFIDQYSSRTALHPDFANNLIALQGHRSYGVMRTEDEGFTWDDVVPGVMSAIVSLVWSRDGAIALATATDGEVLRSVDDGLTWSPVAGLPTEGSSAWLSAGPDGFLAGTDLGVYTSVDGLSWAPDPTLTGSVFNVASAPDGTRYVAMRGGAFFRSDPGGGPWTEVGPELTAHAQPHELKVAADGTVFAAVDDWLYRSTDRGARFELLGPAVVRYEEDTPTLRTNREGGLPNVTMPGASVDRMARLSTGEWLGFSFVGTGVTWLGMGGAGAGIAEVLLDGVVVATVDTSVVTPMQHPMFEDLALVDGPHEIRVANQSGGPVLVDAFQITRSVPVPAVPPIVDTGDPSTTPTEPTTEPPTDGTPPVDTGLDPDPDPDDPDDDGKGCGCATPGGAASFWWLLPVLGLVRRSRVTG